VLSLAITPMTIAGVLVVYRLVRAAMGGPASPDTKELAGSVGFRIAGLHGLIMALVFAQVALVYRNLESDLVQEAQVVGTIFADARRHGGEGTADIMNAAKSYVSIVLSKEWVEQAGGKEPSDEGQKQIDTIFELTLALSASNSVEETLRDGLIAEARRLNGLRAERKGFNQGNNSGPFWFAAISGLAILAACLAPYNPTRRNLALIFGFALYSGIILTLVHSYQNPFVPPGELLPTSFERLQNSMAQGLD
jgi:hypothetical protein